MIGDLIYTWLPYYFRVYTASSFILPFLNIFTFRQLSHPSSQAQIFSQVAYIQKLILLFLSAYCFRWKKKKSFLAKPGAKRVISLTMNRVVFKSELTSSLNHFVLALAAGETPSSLRCREKATVHPLPRCCSAKILFMIARSYASYCPVQPCCKPRGYFFNCFCKQPKALYSQRITSTCIVVSCRMIRASRYPLFGTRMRQRCGE